MLIEEDLAAQMLKTVPSVIKVIYTACMPVFSASSNHQKAVLVRWECNNQIGKGSGDIVMISMASAANCYHGWVYIYARYPCH